MADDGVAGLAFAWLVAGVITAFVTGNWLDLPILIFALFVGVTIADDILNH